MMGEERRYSFLPSNGTEGDIFRSYACCRCRRDHAWHVSPDDGGESCPIIMFALSAYPGPGPKEWWRGGDPPYGCTAFDGPCSCDGGTDEVERTLVHDDQGSLFA